MDIRKVVLGGLVASTAVVLPVAAAGAAVAGTPTYNAPDNHNGHYPTCTPPKPPAPPKPPKHHHHEGDHIQAGFPGGGGGGNGDGVYKPPSDNYGNHNHKPGDVCTCKPVHPAPPPCYYSIFEPPSLYALYAAERTSVNCTPVKDPHPPR